MRLVAIVTLAAALGCAKSGDPAVAPDTVSGSRRYTYVEAGGVQRPVGDVARLEAFPVLSDGTYGAPRAATLDATGGFTIPGIPEGARYLLALERTDGGRVYVDGRARAVDLGARVPGRVDRALPTRATPVALDLSGLAPWMDGDEIQVFATGADLWDTPSFGWTVTADATSISETVDWANSGYSAGTPLVDTAKGDRLWVSQLVEMACPTGFRCRSALRAARIPALTMTEGAAATIAAALEPVTQTGVLGAAWRTTEFEALRAAVHPDATPVSHVLYVDAAAGPLAPDAPATRAGTPDLLVVEAAAGAGDLTAPVAYGRYLPGELPELVSAVTTLQLWVSAPGSTTTRTLPLTIRVGAPMPAGTITPGVSPPRELRVDGAVATGDLAGVGLEPVLSWLPPALGSPTHYIVLLRDLPDAPGPSRRVATIVTRSTSVRLPPGLLQPGASYVAIVTAWVQPGADVESAPLRMSWQFASADAATGVLTP